MAIAQALGLEDGKTYNGLEEFFADMVLKPVRVTVKNEESNGYRNTNVKRWEKDKYNWTSKSPIQKW
ncbi:Protein of uncharacterised function (DUF669) [Enterococcus durans]|uniref:Protein of uncharacterized function (DUF669) n=2 Tax=Enterococcus durans TaxID=53345 RepID=A0A377MQ40_9ENTE|nr:Protein of uncharacterised function (DUF669) [Enterococcus durans]